METPGPPAGTALSQVWLDGDKIRMLAHPLRARLLVALRANGPATATGLAQALHTNTGATSYHLRQLAQVGLVVEETDRGTVRQRWWRAMHQISSWRGTDFDDDPDARAAADWLYRYALRIHAEQADRWVAVQHTYPAQWRDASDLSDYLLRLTPQRLRQLNDELHAVVHRYRETSPPTDTPADDTPADAGTDDAAEQVLLYLHSFPVRGPISLAVPGGEDS